MAANITFHDKHHRSVFPLFLDYSGTTNDPACNFTRKDLRWLRGWLHIANYAGVWGRGGGLANNGGHLL